MTIWFIFFLKSWLLSSDFVKLQALVNISCSEFLQKYSVSFCGSLLWKDSLYFDQYKYMLQQSLFSTSYKQIQSVAMHL